MNEARGILAGPEPDGVIPCATGDWLTGRWDSRKVLRHCHNTWKNLNLRKTMLII